EVGGSRARSGNNHTRFSRYPGISFCRMDRALFVPCKYVPDGISVQGIVNGKYRPSRVTENHFNTLFFQRLNQDICPAAFQLLFCFFSYFKVYTHSVRLLLDYVFRRIKKAFSSYTKKLVLCIGMKKL